MFRHLLNNSFKSIDAESKVVSNMKRGTLVKKVYNSSGLGKEIQLANSDTDLKLGGILTRGTVVTQDVALGYPVSGYEDEQDIVKEGEYAGVEPIQVGEEFATDQFDTSLSDSDVEEGKYLTISNGKLTKSSTATTILSGGWYIDGVDHKLLAFRVIA